MDGERLVWIIILFITVSVVSFSFFISAVAEPYENVDIYKTLKIRHADRPNVCIFEASPEITDKWNIIEHNTIISIKDWEEKLTNMYPDGDWKINIKKTIPWYIHAEASPYDFPECNIMFNYETRPSEDRNQLGTTSINFSKSWHKFAFINVYLEMNNIEKEITFDFGTGESKLDVKNVQIPLDLNTIKNISVHEFGHALGIEHYKINTLLRTNESMYHRSSMIPSIQPFNDSVKLTVTNVDSHMVSKIYGEDGWGGTQPPYIVKYCNILNIILYGCT